MVVNEKDKVSHDAYLLAGSWVTDEGPQLPTELDSAGRRGVQWRRKGRQEDAWPGRALVRGGTWSNCPRGEGVTRRSLLGEGWSRGMCVWGTAKRPAWLGQSELGTGKPGVGNQVGP